MKTGRTTVGRTYQTHGKRHGSLKESQHNRQVLLALDTVSAVDEIPEVPAEGTREEVEESKRRRV